jgi:hypothetical protein
MTERRYTEEEVASIFERAAQAEASPSSPARRTEGRTLAELKAIGREAGFPPELVERAARSLDHGSADTGRRFLGLPIAVGHTVELGRALTDDDWHRLVADLRTTFDARGRIREDGPFRQWTNGNLEALLEPGEGGDRLRLRSLKGQSRSLMAGGLVLLAMAAMITLIFILTGEPSGDWLGPLFMAIMGTGLFGAGALQLPGWAATRRAQMEEVAARAALPSASGPDDAAED